MRRANPALFRYRSIGLRAPASMAACTITAPIFTLITNPPLMILRHCLNWDGHARRGCLPIIT